MIPINSRPEPKTPAQRMRKWRAKRTLARAIQHALKSGVTLEEAKYIFTDACQHQAIEQSKLFVAQFVKLRFPQD